MYWQGFWRFRYLGLRFGYTHFLRITDPRCLTPPVSDVELVYMSFLNTIVELFGAWVLGLVLLLSIGLVLAALSWLVQKADHDEHEPEMKAFLILFLVAIVWLILQS
jgi:uncharacterized membrane-anchored protein